VIHWINLAKFYLYKTAQFLEWYLGILLFQVVFYVAVAVTFIGFSYIRLIRRGS
jgi:hypothetical protein